MVWKRKNAKKAKEASAAIDEHQLSIDDLCKTLGCTIDITNPARSGGLPESIAKERLDSDGPNVLAPPKQKPAILVFLKFLAQLFNLLLITAGVFTFIQYGISPDRLNLYLGSILMAVAILNALLEFIQVQRSAKLLQSFLKLIPARCNVIREGKLVATDAATLVRGDVVFMRMGDKVPADVYVIASDNMRVDNSSLTGESEPLLRQNKCTNKNPLESANIAFNSTLVVSGEGYGVVLRTGDSTMIGQIAGMTQGESKRETPLVVEINSFVMRIGTIAITTAVIFFVVSIYSNGLSMTNALSFAIGVLTAWVPEGLPATVTVLLTIAAKRLSKQNVLVKNLSGVETLGAITLLATDKTGTLTRNQMTVAYYWTQQLFFNAASYTTDKDHPSPTTDLQDLEADNMWDGAPPAPQDEIPFDVEVPGVNDIMMISALSSRARFDSTSLPIAKRNIIGDATETGLFRFATQKLEDYDKTAESCPKVFEIPFNSDNKWAMSIHRIPHENGVYVAYLKGAPERVLRICSHILSSEDEAAVAGTDVTTIRKAAKKAQTIEINESHRNKFAEGYERLAGKGHRVLAFAKIMLPADKYPEGYKFTVEDNNYPSSGYVFIGLASLEDPPKHGVREAVGHCRRAGIKVVMVTGDHPLTAEAIGRKINLMISETKSMTAKRTGVPESSIADDEVHAIVIHGEKIDSLTTADWDMIFAKEEIIFARTSPKHKLMIVKKAQAMGHIVGVTGDGVNDSPALKKADLGIAMNISGSDVSKEAAAMILLDDNFASIVNGIREGRLIFSNLKKAVRYLLTHIMPEVLSQLLYVAANFPLGLFSLQIIAIDLGFELLASLSYAFEPPENERIMRLQPRKPVTPKSVQWLRQCAAFDLQFSSLADKLKQGSESHDAVATAEAGGKSPNSGEQLDLTLAGRVIEEDTTGVVQNGVVVLTKMQKLKRLMSPEYWRKYMFRGSGAEGEVLVDTSLLIYAYLEGGMIESIGSFVVMFTVLYYMGNMTYDGSVNCQKNGGFTSSGAEEFCLDKDGNKVELGTAQDNLRLAQSAYYLTVLIMQIFNLIVCKFRLSYPWGRYLIANKWTFLSILAGFGVGVMFVYIPELNEPFNTSYLLWPLYLLISVAFGVLLYVYNFARTYAVWRWSSLPFIPELPGLQMQPTRFSRTATK